MPRPKQAQNPQNNEEIASPQDAPTEQPQFPTAGQEPANLDQAMQAQAASNQGPVMQAPTVTSLKMKGLPYTVTREEILNFFQNCSLNEDSVKIGVMADGRLTGEACVLFQNPEACQEAYAKLDQKHIGNRWVKLIRIEMDEYSAFEQEQADKYGNNGGGGGFYGSNRRGGGGQNFGDSSYGGRGSRGSRGGRGRGRGGRGGDDGGYGGDRFGGNTGGQGTVRLSDFVNAENRFRALKMRGLPFSVSVREIRDFFEDFRVAERDITIDMNMGRPTGYALVFFTSEEEAQRAKDQLNRQYLGSRYVDLSFPELR